MSVPAIRVHDLTFSYPDGRKAIDDVNLELAANESLGIVGPNGAGKTTLIHLIAGLHRAQSGGVEILGQRFGDRENTALRRHVGVVFQETEDQCFNPTVFEDVAFGPLNFGLQGKSIEERVADALRQVGLAGFEDRVPHHLSSGERRRVALAGVLSCEPSVLLLDEPTSGLDPRGRRELLELLGGMDQALLVASHDLEFVLRTCRRSILIDGGRVIADDPTAKLLADARALEQHGLEPPLGLRGLDREGLERMSGTVSARPPEEGS